MTVPRMIEKVKTHHGFVAALDQSGGSTPKALALYGVSNDSYEGDEAMFSHIHQMRTRIVTSKAFSGDDILGAILFEKTLHSDVGGMNFAHYLWQEKNIVPFLKIDLGLEPIKNNVQLLKPIADLAHRSQTAKEMGVFGTKMRSVIHAADEAGIHAIIKQQFDIGKEILSHGLIPILEPEVNITIADKLEAETIMRDAILEHLEGCEKEDAFLLKLSIPSEANFYSELITHPRIMRVLALSGGYERDEANALLSQNKGMIASFSRAFLEGLHIDLSEAEFNACLSTSIHAIKEASQ